MRSPSNVVVGTAGQEATQIPGASDEGKVTDQLVIKGEASATSSKPSSGKPRPTVLDVHGYKVGKTLGHGSYATVKESLSAKHQCLVAIKIISKKRAPADYLEKFLPREIDVVKLLKHPNLVVFLQSIETNNRVYLIMEHVSNGDLLEVIRARKFIKESQACIWFQELIDGVDYCHQKGVVHRDLKCENVLLDESNTIKITDFGFARSGMKQRPNGDFPLSETYCGSYAYAPPEILSGTPYVAQMADIWSTGVILYVMVFGRLPFDDSNHKKLLRQIHRGPAFPENRDVSVKCKDLITRLLVKKDIRIQIPQIRKHSWFYKQTKTDGSVASKHKTGTSFKSVEPSKKKSDWHELPSSLPDDAAKSKKMDAKKSSKQEQISSA